MRATQRHLSVRNMNFAAGAILLSMINWCAEGMLKNNGDYWRVSRLLRLTFPTGEVPNTSWGFDTGPSHHAATLFAAGCRIVDIVLRPLHLQSFNMLWLYIPLCLFYFIGTYIAANQLRTRSDVLVSLLFFAVFAIYGFITKSFYEESLLLILAPWLYWAIRVFHRTRNIFPVLIVGFLVVATKQQSMALIPAILALMFYKSRWNRKTASHFLLVVTALAVAALTLNVRIGVFRYTDANRYDRLMHGVGAAMGNIAFQKGSHSDDWRHAITNERGYADPPVAGLNSCQAIPEDVRRYLGSANWPLGIDLQVNDPAEYEKIIHAGRWGSFLKILGTCPVPSSKLLVNMTVGVVRTDYRMDYIRTHRSEHILLRPFIWVRDTCLHFWGWGMAVLALLTVVRLKSWKQRLAALFCFLMLPFGVIAGDGFYEFEKHTIVFIGFFPLIYLLFQTTGPNPKSQD